MSAYKEYRFSDLIEEIEERNISLEYGLDDIVGVTIEKGLIPTIANLTQTALDKFYIVKPDTFVYNPRTHGVRLGMGYNDTNKTFLTSWNNVAFRVKEDAKKIVLSKYLWIYFNRPEWDRQTNFMAWGSSTIVFAWNDFLSIKIQLPDLKEQEKIVKTYNTITKRIQLKQKINENLEKTAQCLFEAKVLNNINIKYKTIGSFGKVITGKTPLTDIKEYYGNEVPFIKTPDMHNGIFVTQVSSRLSIQGAESQSQKYIREKSVVVACIGVGIGEVAITSKRSQTNQQINSVETDYPFLLYFGIKNSADRIRAAGLGGSTMPNLNRKDFENFLIPTIESNIGEVENELNKICILVCDNQKEMDQLYSLKQLVISRISGM